MKKNKIIAIVLSSIALCCGIAYLVAYLKLPEETINFTLGLKEFFVQPLPIVGVSLTMICLFAWKLFKTSSFGKKQVQKIWDLIEEKNKELGVQKAEMEKTIDALKSQLEKSKAYAEKLKSYVDEVAKTIPNKKVNKLVDQFDEKENNDNGKEKENIETREE